MTKLTLEQQEVIIENLILWCKRRERGVSMGTCTFCDYYGHGEEDGRNYCACCPFTILKLKCDSRHELAWRIRVGDVWHKENMSLTLDELSLSAEEHAAAIVDFLCSMLDLGTE